MAMYNYLSKEGYEQKMAELEKMKSVDRRAIADDIAEAREKGDLSENAEYKAAKDAQGYLELKISELQNELSNAKILDESTIDTSEVRLLSAVTIKNKKNGKEVRYKLVSKTEADLKAKKISLSSPMGQGLIGKKVGEIAIISSPGGNMEFEIMDIGI